jgi:hypothetical protein
MAVPNTLAYYYTTTITAVKNFYGMNLGAYSCSVPLSDKCYTWLKIWAGQRTLNRKVIAMAMKCHSSLFFSHTRHKNKGIRHILPTYEPPAPPAHSSFAEHLRAPV